MFLRSRDGREEPVRSLEHFCKRCDKRCCKKGPVLVLPREKDRIVARTGRTDCWQDRGSFFVLIGEPCPFLVKGRCRIYGIRPADCRAYPIFVRPRRRRRDEWRVDPRCPASAALTADFIRSAQRGLGRLPRHLKEQDWRIASREAGFCTRPLRVPRKHK